MTVSVNANNEVGFGPDTAQIDITSLFLDSDTVSEHTSNIDVSANIYSVISLTAGSKVNLNISPGSTGKLSSGRAGVVVSTNNRTGYNLTMSMVGAGTDLSDGTTNKITATTATAAAPGALGDNTWGYRVDGLFGFGNGPTILENNVGSSIFTWAGVPPLSSPVTIKTSNTFADHDLADVFFAAKANSSLPVGKYTNTVVFTAVAK